VSISGSRRLLLVEDLVHGVESRTRAGERLPTASTATNVVRRFLLAFGDPGDAALEPSPERHQAALVVTPAFLLSGARLVGRRLKVSPHAANSRRGDGHGVDAQAHVRAWGRWMGLQTAGDRMLAFRRHHQHRALPSLSFDRERNVHAI